MTEAKKQSLVLTLITGAFAVTMGFVLYRIITQAMNQPNEVEDTLNASGRYRGSMTTARSGRPCNCANGKTLSGCQRSCDECCGLAEQYPTFYD